MVKAGDPTGFRASQAIRSGILATCVAPALSLQKFFNYPYSDLQQSRWIDWGVLCPLPIHGPHVPGRADMFAAAGGGPGIYSRAGHLGIGAWLWSLGLCTTSLQ